MKFVHETKTKYEDKISLKDDTKCIITHYRMSNMPPYEACNLHIDSLGNTHPLKVDRNLQLMSHHPTNPTYNPVLSGTMTHLSARCQKQHYQDTQYKYIHPKGVYQPLGILCVNILKMWLQYMWSQMQQTTQITNTQATV